MITRVSDVNFDDTVKLSDLKNPLFGATSLALSLILAKWWLVLWEKKSQIFVTTAMTPLNCSTLKNPYLMQRVCSEKSVSCMGFPCVCAMTDDLTNTKLLPSGVGKSTDIIIRSIWLSVDDPGNSGLPSNISPSIQPRLHMSTPLVYLYQTYASTINKFSIRSTRSSATAERQHISYALLSRLARWSRTSLNTASVVQLHRVSKKLCQLTFCS